VHQLEATAKLCDAIEDFARSYGLSFREALQVIANEHVEWASNNSETLWLSILEVANAGKASRMGR